MLLSPLREKKASTIANGRVITLKWGIKVKSKEIKPKIKQKSLRAMTVQGAIEKNLTIG